ncbi:hypothetical protein HF086_001547 [Spodoptera exigua]|uniref:Uncharacterized protein n=1 Tax=Spodoptera exigua TaxID=7107 RepID=A0A922MRA7_SPOEX|nr:hypothetical protein HF086_001547 [Spodoptera exigua]
MIVSAVIACDVCVAEQEYTEEFRDIAKGKSKESLPTGPITLLNQRPVSEDVCSTTFFTTTLAYTPTLNCTIQPFP